MASKDTFFLRTKLASSGTTYVSDEIDISAFTNPSEGRILVIDRSFITFGTVGNGPIGASNVVSTSTGSKGIGVQVTSETQTGLVEMTDNSLVAKVNYYAAVNPAGALSFVNEMSALNPGHFVAGMIVPTDKIHCGCQTGSAWNTELDIGFLFEVHTEKLSLRRIQELLLSLTAN
jgi:hypothetical protein